MKEIYTFYKKMLPILALLLVCSTKLFATDYYWIGRGATNNWSEPANWATTSGAAQSDVLVVPYVGDNVIVDANSFPGTSTQITVNQTAYCDSLIFKSITAGRMPTLTINAEIYISGSVLLYPGMTIDGSTARTLYLQSKRTNETIGYIDGVTALINIPHNINISESANWVINGSFSTIYHYYSYYDYARSFTYSSTGNLTVKGDLIAGILNSSSSNIDISTVGNVLTDNIISGDFSFSGNGNLTVNGNLTTRMDMSITGTGVKNITGDLTIGYAYSSTSLEYGPINIGGNLMQQANNKYIQKGCIVTVEGNVEGLGGFTITNPGSELRVKGSIIMGYIIVTDYGTLNNVNYNDITLISEGSGEMGAFRRTSNGVLLGLSGITLTCRYWENASISMTASDAPALIRIDRGYFRALSTDVYNNVEISGVGVSPAAITQGTFNKITFLPTSRNYSISSVGSITTDSLIISAQSEFQFYNRPTYVNKYLEIVPQPCGGMISIKGTDGHNSAIGTIAMGSGSNVNVKNTRIENMTITGATPYSTINSVNAGGNSGWTFSSTRNTYYWVGGGGNWDDVAHWANMSGGASGSGCIPTIFDNVIFDQNSGLNNTDTVTTNEVTVYCDSMTWHNISGAPTFEITLNASLYMSGSLELNAGMNFIQNGGITENYSIWFVSNRAGETIKSNGVIFKNIKTCFHSGYVESQALGAGNGGWTLLDDLFMEANFSNYWGGGAIYFYRGNLNFGGKTVTANNFISNSALNRTLNIANSLITLNACGGRAYGWNYSGTNSSVLTATETNNSLIRINCHDAFDGDYTYGLTAKSGDTYFNMELNTIKIGSPYSRGTITSGIFNKITLLGIILGLDFTFAGTNLTTDSLFLSADLGNTYRLSANIKVNKYLQGQIDCGLQSYLTSDNTTARLITMGSGAVVNLKDMLITNVNITGDGSPYPAPDCELGIGTETGWDISSSAGTGRYYWVGGTGNWTDMSHWSNISGGGGDVYCTPPKSVNTVVFDENSFTADNQSVTVNYHAFCDSMLWSNIPYTNPILIMKGGPYTSPIVLTISGSVVLQQGMTVQMSSYASYSNITLNSTRNHEIFKTNGVFLGASEYFYLSIYFTNTGEMDIPDGIYISVNFPYIYFGMSSISNTAKWKFGGPLQPSTTSGSNVFFNFGTLDLSESGDDNQIRALSYTTGATNHSTARELIIKNTTINVYDSWNYNGILTVGNSENSTINLNGNNSHTMTTSDNQVYNNVNIISAYNSYPCTLNVPAGVTTYFNKVVLQGKGTLTVNRGIYKHLQFLSSATLNGIEADTLNLNNSSEFIYTFTSGVTSTINKKWYGNGTPCTRIRIESSDVNGTPNQATITVKKEATTLPGDTLFLDFIRLNGIYFTDGIEYAKILTGPGCSGVPGSAPDYYASRYFNDPVLGKVTNWTYVPYNSEFDRLGPDLTLCYNDYPYTLTSEYYVTTPTSTFEWKKGTTTGSGGVALNANPTTDHDTDTWTISAPDAGVENYWLRVLYPVQSGPPCPLVGSVKITPTNIPAPVCEESYILCYGNTIADLIAEIGGDIVIFANPDGGSALNGATPLQNNTTYYVSQTIDECESIERTTVEVKLKYCGNVFEIWNWADLAYLNVLIENEEASKNSQPLQGNLDKLTDYEVFLLMQDLGSPDGSFGNGDLAPQSYQDDIYRKYGWYGYENLFEIGKTDNTGDTLFVGPGRWKLDRQAWDMIGNTGWIPVGSYHYINKRPFFGEFNGQNFAANKMWINRAGSDYQGLFGYVNDATIKNMSVNIKGTLTGQYYVAGLVGSAKTTTFNNCHVNGDVKGIYYIAGLVGAAENISINNCSTTGNIEGKYYLGGLVGNAQYNLTILHSHAIGNVTAPVSGDNYGSIGGLVGSIRVDYYSGSQKVEIDDCYAIGNVRGVGNMGGFIGYIRHDGALVTDITIRNCYSTGDVTGIGGIGGFIGVADMLGDAIGMTVENCYATNGTVFGEGMMGFGGFIGGIKGDVAVSSCWTDINVVIENFNNTIGKFGYDYCAIGGFAGSLYSYYSNGYIKSCFANGNITIVDVNGASFYGLGGFAGIDDNYAITSCYATGTVAAEDAERVGGFAGMITNGSVVTNSYATGNVEGKDKIGGFAGFAESSCTISNSFALNSSVDAMGATDIARFIGKNDGATLTNNHAKSCMTINGDTIPVSNPDVATNLKHGASISFTDATTPVTFKAAPYANAWDWTNTWAFVTPPSGTSSTGGTINVKAGTNLPVLQVFSSAIPIFETTVQEAIVEDCEKVFRIWNWADLAYLNVLIDNKVNGTKLGNGKTIDYYELFLLMQDLGTPDDINSYGKGVATEKNGWVTCPYSASQPERHLGCYGYENFISGSTYDYTQLLVGNGTGWLLGRQAWDMTGNTGWIPVGKNDTYPFVGNFDGQGFEIDSLWIYETSTTEDYYLGLFGYVHDAKIENVGVNTAAKGVEFNSGTPAQEVFAAVGVLAALANGATSITNCYTTGHAESHAAMDNAHVGGLIATMYGKSTVTNCYSKADVVCFADDCGGLLGAFIGDSITNCYATGNVTFQFDKEGPIGAGAGFIGGFSGKLTNSYATGKVTTTTNHESMSSGAAGFIAGIISPDAIVENCYSTGEVEVNINAKSDMSSAGGFVSGLLAGKINNCYSTSNVTLNVNYPNTEIFVGGFAGGTVDFYGFSGARNINNSYATGTVNVTGILPLTNIAVGGFTGYADASASITNSFALNPSIDAPDATDIARFVGKDDGADLSNNYALHCMTLNGDLVDPSDPDIATHLKHGENILFRDVIDPVKFKAAPYANAWDWTNSWVFPGGGNVQIAAGTNLPVLQAFNQTKPIFENTVQKAIAEQCEKERYWIYDGDPENGATFIYSYHWLQDAVNRVWTEDGGTFDHYWYGPVGGHHFFIVATETDTNVTEGGTYSPTTAVTIPEGMILTLTSLSGEIDTIIQPNYARHIQMMTGASLTLTNIIIEGKGYKFVEITGNENGGIDVYNGELIVEEGAIIRKNVCANFGGGVLLHGANSKFTINGGEISNNEAEEGGGLSSVWGGGEIKINGGKIKDNKSYHNSNGAGGGINAFASYGNSLSVMMTGGEITGNSGIHGGGVAVWGSGSVTTTFTMTGGTISNNHAASYGGGVYVNCDFIMYDGAVISGNSAGAGGGVFTNGNNVYHTYDDYFTFTMEGGLIDGNSAGLGGGVAIWDRGKLIMNNGKIINNKAAYGNYISEYGSSLQIGQGGGVWVEYGSSFEMNGGIISRDTAIGVSTHISLGELLAMMGVDSTDILTYLGIANFNEFTLNELPLFFAVMGVQEEEMVYILVEIGFNENDLLNALTALGLQIEDIDNSNIGTLLTEMGIDGQGFIEVLTNYFSSVFGIANTGSGGGVFLLYDATLTMTGGKIFENLASEDGGGIFTMNYDYPTPMNAYDNITIPNNCTDSVYDNRALAGKFIPPTEPLWDKAFEISLLDNDQVNYRGKKADDCANPPTVDFDGPDEICEGTTTQLTPADKGWMSDNPSIATVDASGRVTALKAGTATFTFTDSNNCTATTAPLTVKPKVKVSATIKIKN